MYKMLALTNLGILHSDMINHLHVLTPLFTLTCGLKGKSVCKRVMWITYQQPVDSFTIQFKDNYKSAILCISLATLYRLKKYNGAFITKETPK